MQKEISIRLRPAEAAEDAQIIKAAAAIISLPEEAVNGFIILKRSIDARGKQAWINLTLRAFINEPAQPRQLPHFHFRDVQNAKHKVIIVGAGPAGLFAALALLEAGIQPIVIERGKDVRARRRDLAQLNKEGEVNPESNYCFGEGGAGTYSDGKLYTRSSKRGDVHRILSLFVHFGAEEKILHDAHPHIGTNKLPRIITAMRDRIVAHGGKVLFEKKLSGLIINNNKLTGINTTDGDELRANAVILATGHSARDVFHLLHDSGIHIEAKPFALGVRAEHPQTLIDCTQYHCPLPSQRPQHLPPAAYSLVQQVNGKGVFSFCMCPGGIIAPAATSPGELVVNGWSPSRRDNPYANSGIVAQVEPSDLAELKDFETVMDLPKKALQSPLGMLYFQQYVERKAFAAGGGSFVAPTQRLVDFATSKHSASLPSCSYIPGIHSVSLKSVLPPTIHSALQLAFIEFGKKMKGYYTNEAVVVATESRTSSPVRIPRDAETLQHPQVPFLYPCGEGAGYAGGIVSAAMDGERVVKAIIPAIGAGTKA